MLHQHGRSAIAAAEEEGHLQAVLVGRSALEPPSAAGLALVAILRAENTRRGGLARGARDPRSKRLDGLPAATQSVSVIVLLVQPSASEPQ